MLQAITTKVKELNDDGVHYPMWVSGTSAVAWFGTERLDKIKAKNWRSGLA